MNEYLERADYVEVITWDREAVALTTAKATEQAAEHLDHKNKLLLLSSVKDNLRDLLLGGKDGIEFYCLLLSISFRWSNVLRILKRDGKTILTGKEPILYIGAQRLNNAALRTRVERLQTEVGEDLTGSFGLQPLPRASHLSMVYPAEGLSSDRSLVAIADVDLFKLIAEGQQSP